MAETTELVARLRVGDQVRHRNGLDQIGTVVATEGDLVIEPGSVRVFWPRGWNGRDTAVHDPAYLARLERLSAPVDGLETTRVEQGWGLPWDLKLLLLKIGHRWITYDEAERLSSWVQAARQDIARLQAEVERLRALLPAPKGDTDV